MDIVIRNGPFEPASLEPKGPRIWEATIEQISSAALTPFTDEFKPGEWIDLRQFKSIVEKVRTSAASEEVPSVVTVGIADPCSNWSASIDIGQNRATLMMCDAIISFAAHQTDSSNVWIRID